LLIVDCRLIARRINKPGRVNLQRAVTNKNTDNPPSQSTINNQQFMSIVVTGSIAYDYLMSFPG
jgi:hypothetical protein